MYAISILSVICSKGLHLSVSDMKMFTSLTISRTSIIDEMVSGIGATKLRFVFGLGESKLFC